MVNVPVQIMVEDFDTFYSGFENRGFPLRRKHGSKGSQVFRHADDESGRERMEGFLADPDVQASMKRGGTVGQPTITYLDLAGNLGA